MAQMNIKMTLNMLRHCPLSVSVLISGNHGIGKSAIVKQIAAEQGIPCIDFRLSQNDVSDLKGMPFHIKGRTVFAIPEFFPIREADAIELKDLLGLAEDISIGRYGERGILFLDEINRANREVQQAAFELVLDRRLNLRSLPDGWRVVAAINGDDTLYTVNEMEPAFLSRFMLIDLKPTIQEWMEWAEGDGHIHDAVIQFMHKKAGDFLDPLPELIKEASKRGVEKVHDRRAWEMFSRTLTKFEEDYAAGSLPFAPLAKNEEAYSQLILLAGAFVGHMASLAFKTFIEMDYDALDANVILNRFDANIRKKLVSIVEAGRTPELAAYNDMLVAYIKKNIKTKLSVKQKQNLTEYVCLLPNELVGNFWQHFNEELKEISEDWYGHDEKSDNGRTSEKIMGALVNPNATPKKKVTAKV
jgi:hypothetical protein